MPSNRFHPVAAGSLIPTIDTVHKKIHDGKSFAATHSVVVGTGTAVTVLISTPASNNIHFAASVESDKGITWTFSEAPNASGGTALVEYNCNRNSTTTSGSVLTHTVTYVSAGSIFETHSIGTSGGPTSISGGLGNVRKEYILIPSTLYLIRAVAGAATTTVNINLDYYLVEN